MKRATITVPDDVEEALDAYMRDQEVPPALTSVTQAALRQFLAERGYLPPQHTLHITPAERGSGHTDVSTNHDQYFADP